MFRPSEHFPTKRSWLFRSHDIPFKQNWPLHIMIAVFVIVWVITAINPVDWKDWLLENILPVLLIGALASLYRAFPFNNVSYLLITVFLILHAIGAHYTYQDTPVDALIKRIFHTKVLLASSASFEIIEMLVSLLVNLKLAAKYLGLQGDPLDTQKDMSMALIGALLSVGLMGWYRYLRHRKLRNGRGS